MRGDGGAAGRASDRPEITGGIENDNQFASLRRNGSPALMRDRDRLQRRAHWLGWLGLLLLSWSIT